MQHHLVDPTTQAPVDNDVVAATVVAREGWRAEVLAKAAFVAGRDVGLALLDAAGAAGAVFDTRRRTARVARLAAFALPIAPAAPVRP